VDELLDETGSYHDELLRRLHPFVRSLQAKAGISDPMHDLSQARLFFLQASTTLENGSLIHPDQSIYAYQDYALVGMVVNALGDMPVEMLFSEGFRRLVEHDRESQASYLDTLRVLLDCNMSITKASRMLYVHRSTLLERIARIKRDLDEDLDDPDVRLRLQLVLKALSIRDTMGER
jgi:DNA-binding PucR family transcriptional regulator